MQRLEGIHPDFNWVGKSDAMGFQNGMIKNDAGGRYGGVTVLWHRDLDATPIGDNYRK